MLQIVHRSLRKMKYFYHIILYVRNCYNKRASLKLFTFSKNKNVVSNKVKLLLFPRNIPYILLIPQHFDSQFTGFVERVIRMLSIVCTYHISTPRMDNLTDLLSNATTTNVPCELDDTLYSKPADIVIGTLHLLAGIMALLGNGIVFCAYFREAAQRASACMFVQVCGGKFNE